MTTTMKALLAAALTFLPQAAAAKVGLSTQFVDVEFDGLKPGGVYNLRELRGVPYTVRNRSDAAVEVFLEAQTPPSDRVTKPYEPIPDASWIELNPGRMRVDANSIGFADVVVRIPDDPTLNGRHFEARIWARTAKFGAFSVGVHSRLRLSIGPSPETVERKRLEEAIVTLNYDLWPNALYVQKAKVGEVYDAKAAEKRAFMLTNRAEEPLTLIPEAMRWPTGSVSLPSGGWETLEDLSWVKFEPAEVVVDPLSVKELRLRVENAPAALAGRRIAFIVALKLPNGMTVNATHRGFVTFAAAEPISAPEAPEKK